MVAVPVLRSRLSYWQNTLDQPRFRLPGCEGPRRSRKGPQGLAGRAARLLLRSGRGRDGPGRNPPLTGLTLAEIEKRALWEALKRHQWRRLATARELGIDKNTLRRKLRRFGLTPPSRAARE